jgi:hypothetical protein
VRRKRIGAIEARKGTLAMNVLRGTFRLSIVVALLVAAYFGITAHVAAQNAASESWKLWFTLRCGERFLGQDMSAYTNASGLIDIGKAGCSNDRFLATFDEIREALASAEPSGDRYGEVFWPKLYGALFNALGAFLFVNLLGLLFLGTRRVFRWISAGYR